MFEMGNEVKQLQASNSALVKGSGSAEDRVSAADDFQPSGLPGKPPLADAAYLTPRLCFCRAFIKADLAHSTLCFQTVSLPRARAAEHAGALQDPVSLYWL